MLCLIATSLLNKIDLKVARILSIHCSFHGAENNGLAGIGHSPTQFNL